MKFLCDRCKTRYSIGDDRVRGKILKIRCKNCANVITVREGMPDVDAAPEPRGQKRTTLAPAEASATPAPSNGAHHGSSPGTALGAAFATAMTKPPPALEEEWYVSIDGDQAGPYTLAEAQRWVGGKPFDADLHCWSEGFDDWLPVDKVSHFRGLRKKPAPAPQPPPRPPIPAARPPGLVSRDGLAARPHEPMRIDESEPKPLFAATMASLEKSSSTSSSANINLSAMAAAAAAPAPAPATNGAPRIGTNGAAARATPPKGNPVVQAHGNGTAPNAALPRAGGALPRGNTTGDPSTVRGVGVPSSVARPGTAPGGAERRPPFDPAATEPHGAKPGQTTLGFDSSELAESATQIEPAPFADEKTAAEPVASRVAARPGTPAAAPAPAPAPARPDVFAQAMAARTPAPAPAPAPGYAPPKFGVTDSLTALESESAATAPRMPNPVAPPPRQQDDDADIDIGEVSRVVKLADIAPRPAAAGQPQTRRSGPIGTTTSMNVNRAVTNATGPVGRVNATGAVARINATGSVARINATGAVAKLDALPNTFAVEAGGSLEPAVVTASPVQAQHKRGLVLLLLGAAVLLGVAIVVVFMVFMKDDEERSTQTAVVDDYSIDSTRPDLIVAPKNGSGSQAIIPTPGSGSEKKPPTGPNTKITPWKPPETGSGGIKTPKLPDPPDPPPGAAKLDTGEVEAMARSTNGATSTCFIRSNKGTEAILLADVKRVPVDFTIAPDGTVKSASIGVEAGLAKLSNCLRGVVGTWKFRPSAGGNYRIILVPPS